MLLNEQMSSTVQRKYETIQGCYLLLKYMEQNMSHVYSGGHWLTASTLIPQPGYNTGPTQPLQPVYQPGLLVEPHTQPRYSVYRYIQEINRKDFGFESFHIEQQHC